MESTSGEKPIMTGVVTSRVPLMRAMVEAMTDALAHDGNLKVMLARQWNVAPSIDPSDVLSIDFEPHDDLDFPFMAIAEVAYGHRYLADFVLDHLLGECKDRIIIDPYAGGDIVTVNCDNCLSRVLLEPRSLKGMPVK